VLANDRTCTPLPPQNLNGKEGVDGSSPSEGSLQKRRTSGLLRSGRLTFGRGVRGPTGEEALTISTQFEDADEVDEACEGA
jgi:hypothetical protein